MADIWLHHFRAYLARFLFHSFLEKYAIEAGALRSTVGAEPERVATHLRSLASQPSAAFQSAYGGRNHVNIPQF